MTDTAPAPTADLATDLAKNPLYRMADHPPFAQITVEHVEPAIRALLAESHAELAAIEADAPTTWAGLMDRLDLHDDLSKSWGVLAHLMSVHNSDALREAYQMLQPEIVEISNAYGQSRVLYDCYCAIRDGEEHAALCPAQKRILKSAIQAAELAGVALEGDARDRFGEIAKRLAELSTTFSNHVLDDTKKFELLLSDLDEVEGLPASLRSLAANTAKSRGHEFASAEMGPWLITLDFPSFGPFLQHARRRDLRKTVYKAYIQRCSGGEFDNRPLIDEILSLRAEKAKLLGFATFAELSLSQKMAPSVDAAEGLLIELRETCRAAGKTELDELNTYAAAHGFDDPAGLKHWDAGFWSERLREEQYDIEQEALRPFFPLPSVLAGLFELTEQTFGVTVRAADGEQEVWNEDVRYFHVEDGGELLATLYFDPYSRPADKRGGAWVNICATRSKLHATGGEAVRLPVTYMVCNQSPPDGDTPSLMTFGEVVTLFHEFGHALHNMLTEVDYAGAAGICNVEWDAVELPSQFMENFCTHKPTLAKLAKHYQSGATLDEAIMDRLISARTFRAGSNFLRQICFGLTDLELHSRFDAATETPHDVNRRIGQETLPLAPLDDDWYLCGFQHIFAGGYCAGYYSYKWAEVLSADAFEAFEEAGLDDPAAVAKTGRRFRNTVLAKGGSEHPMDIFKEFRGREPKPDALLRHNNLK